MAQNVVDCDEFFLAFFRRIYILLLWDEVFSKCQSGQVDWSCYSDPFNPYWFSAWWIYQVLREGYEITKYMNGLICSFSLSGFASCVLTRGCRVNTHLRLLCILAELILLHYVMSLFVLDNFCCSVVCFIEISMAMTAFFWLALTGVSISVLHKNRTNSRNIYIVFIPPDSYQSSSRIRN